MDNMIKSEDYYFAFIDLLSSKNMIEQDDDAFLNKIKKSYDSCKRIQEAFYRDSIKIKIYSDNISFAMKVDNNYNVNTFIKYISYMAQYLLRFGLMPRGGICKGRLYFDDSFVLGKALVKAYKMESEKAIYPRIIVDDEVVNDLSDYVKQDVVFVDKIDKEWVLDLFTPYGVDYENIKNQLHDVHSWFDERYEQIKKEKNNKVCAKYYWLDNYLKRVEKKCIEAGRR